MSKLANQQPPPPPPSSDMDVDSADAAEEKNLVRFSINGELLLPLQLPDTGLGPIFLLAST
jgi:hypothetical protein